MLSLSGLYLTLDANLLALSQLIYALSSALFFFWTLKVVNQNMSVKIMGSIKTYLVSFIMALLIFLILFKILKYISIDNQNYLSIALMLFVVGIFNVLARKNIIAILIGAQLLLFSASLNFVAYAKHSENNQFVLGIIIISVIEFAVTLMLMGRFFNIKKSVNIDDASRLKN